MATRSDPTRHHRPQQQQQQQQPQKKDQERYTQGSTPQVYTLYPDPPLRRTSVIQLPPSPSQLLPKEKSKSANKSGSPSNKAAQPTVSTHSHSPSSKYQPTSPQSRVQQQQQLYSPTPKSTLPSPISPSSSASAGFAIRDVNATTEGARYDKSQYQHPRQTQPNRQHGYQQTPVMELVYGGTVPRQTGSSVPAHKHAQGGHAHGHDMPKQQSFSGSSVSLAPSASSSQYQNGLKQNASSASPRPGQLISPAASPRNDQPALLPDIPSSSLSLSFERDYQEHEKHHQQQALQYQQRLQQKPPKQSGEDTDDDSDSGSILSYRRSVHRMSMTYKGRPGVPNISLFAPSQRPQIVQYSRSPTGSPSKEQQEERQQAVGKGVTSYNQQDDLRTGDFASGSSLASIDQNRYYGRLDDDGRPRTARSNTANTPAVARPKEIQIPERSVSADDIYKQNNSGRQPRQHPAASQQPHWKDHPYPSNHHPYPDNAASSLKSTHLTSHLQQYEPRPSHESARSMRSQYTRPRPEAYGHSGGSEPSRSMSPTRVGGSNGFVHHPLPSTTRVGAGAGYDHSKVNMHPAHHNVKGGYVRPEEAMGPSNPMPEQAEDYVRKGIESHESGDLTKATNSFRTAAELGDPVGMLMYGLSVRHGWGCTPNRLLAFQYLQKSAEHAVGDLNSRDSFASTAAKSELVLAIYELGICFRHGWGVEKNKKTAAYYFEIAANLGDPDAQNDLAWCYYHGVGVKKDMFASAKYYRMAAAQGMELMGNSWIWKDKYGGPSSATTTPVEPKNVSQMIPIVLPHN